MKQQIKNGIIFWLTTWIIFTLFWVVYAAWNDTVSNGDTVSASSWNGLVTQVQSQAIPAWFVWSFNLASCPTGWSEADGTWWTPDLRWEFIRGLDNGRGVDPWRVLSSSQGDEFKSHNHEVVDFSRSSLSGIINGDGWTPKIFSDDGPSDSSPYDMFISQWGTETRPQNVALLYCIKN